VLAPLGADAAAIARHVGACGLSARECATPAAFAEILEDRGPEGVLLAIVSQEGAREETGRALARAFAAEPSWARLPVLFLVSDGERPPAAVRLLDRKKDAPPIVVLERPVRPVVLSRVLEALVEGRRRQFETRDLLHRLKREEEQRAFLLAELRHRTRNMLGVLQSLFSLSARRAGNVEALSDSFGARLRSLSAAHARLSEASEGPDDLAMLLTEHVLPYADSPEQLRIEGRPPIVLADSIAFDFAMVIHELATNAAKYGALSRPEGSVEANWWVEPSTGSLRFRWQERGGPAVAAPEKAGLGRSVIERLPSGAAETTLTFDPAGVSWTALIGPQDFQLLQN
jgi:two-component sensor histidine kinase